jgi:amidohydrolase
MTIDFEAQANAMRDELVARRRDFHQHPETAFEEVRTSGIVAAELNKLGLEVQTRVGKTGVIGILEGTKDGPTVLVRADMDALPMSEDNQVEYASQTPQKMHACGHDGHTTIALGVAKLFSQHRDKIQGRIKFVFQPAEEIGAGAKAMIADGALQNPKPDVSLGLHLWNTMPLGKVGVADGPVMASPSIFEFTIQGKGGHGAMPDQTIDPVVCAAQMIMAFQTIASRNADPLGQLALSVTQVITGDAKNIIPDTAYLAGTFRTFTPEMREMVNKRMREIAEHTAAAMGCTVSINISNPGNPVVNHPEVSSVVRNAFRKLGKAETDLVMERTTAAEDVGEFMTDIPGMFFFVGSGNEAKGLTYPHHHPRFDFDEDALPLSVALLSAAVAEYVFEGV